MLDRVKALRPLTLPCQRTNPDGVICGDVRVGMDVYGNRIEFVGVICGGVRVGMDVYGNRIEFVGVICRGTRRALR